MKYRYILIGIVIVIFAINVYVYTSQYLLPVPLGPSPSLDKDFLTQIKICQNLSEEQCFANDDCIGNYGPSHCSPDGMCTADMVFHSCSPSLLNSDEIQQIKSECEKINGELKKERIGGYECLCIIPNTTQKERCLQDLINQLKNN